MMQTMVAQSGAPARQDSSGQTKVLLVDDRPDNLLALKAVLEPLGQELVTARTAKEALQQVAHNRGEFSVALLDVHLPGLGGFELAEALKADQRTENMPIIFVTGSADLRGAFAGYAAGAVDYILKPFDPDILRSKVAVFVELALSKRHIAELADTNRALLDATGDAIRLVDRDGSIPLSNPAMDRMLHEVIGVSGVGSADEQAIEIAARTTQPERYLSELRIIFDNPEVEAVHEYTLAGSGRCIRRRIAPVRDSSGTLIGQIVVLREVTAERQAERLKDDLMATVSHELRTPLASLLGFSQLLLHRQPDAQTRRSYIQLIHDEAARLTGLVNELLDLQRIERGSFGLTLARTDLTALLRRSIALFSGQSSTHTLELAPLEEPLLIDADAHRIEQVVANLLSNAIKYSPDGGTITVTATHSNERVRVSVRDKGLGIPAAQQAQIFTKFFRAETAEARTIGGTGLGLALSREWIDAHSGSMGFDSIEGEGSTFWFELPQPTTGSPPTAF